MANELRADELEASDAGDPAASPASAIGPVYVDLDGTLIASDMLWETIWLLLRKEPLSAFKLPLWVRHGKAAFKGRVAERVSFDPAHLPYREPVLRHLEAAREQGRRLVLATASDRRVAEPICEHLGLFDSFLASDGALNLSEQNKSAAIETDAAGEPYEYLGNSSADLPIWEHAATATLVAPTRGAREGAARLSTPSRTLPLEPVPGHPAIKALRSYQWVKNALLFVPIVLAHEISDLSRTLAVALAFACFCAIASATYMLNDLLDIESDRRHPRKCKRPFASGSLSIPTGLAMIGGLLFLGFATSLAFQTLATTGMLLLYTVLTVSYSFYVKEQLFIDVLLLAGLYTHRVLTGAVAARVNVSPWLLAFSLFFFLSLALVKRYAELLAAQDREGESLSRRAYQVNDTGLVETMGLSSGFMSVLVLCLFISSDDVSKLYPSPELLWLVCPIFLYWIGRMWFLAQRRVLSDDPVLFAATDRGSYLTGALILVVGTLASL